jgi:hypothetical protein
LCRIITIITSVRQLGKATEQVKVKDVIGETIECLIANDLDGGTGDVSIKEKYINNGWQTFVAAFGPENSEKARQIEEAEWWK